MLSITEVAKDGNNKRLVTQQTPFEGCKNERSKHDFLPSLLSPRAFANPILSLRFQRAWKQDEDKCFKYPPGTQENSSD